MKIVFNRKKTKKKKKEYCKNMLNFILINSIAMMWCSYILAWFGRADIAVKNGCKCNCRCNYSLLYYKNY